MKKLPKLFFLPVVIILAWMGANIYHGNDLFANPFKEQSVLDKIESRGSNFFDDALEDAGDAAKDSYNKGVDNIGDALKDITE